MDVKELESTDVKASDERRGGDITAGSPSLNM